MIKCDTLSSVLVFLHYTFIYYSQTNHCVFRWILNIKCEYNYFLTI